MLILAKSALSGNIMGRPIEGFVLDKGTDAAPAPGEYTLLPPLDDPVFGSFIIAVRRDAAYKPAYIWSKLTADTGLAVQFEIQDLRTVQFEIQDLRTAGPAKAAPDDAYFVISKQPIPGRNGVVLAAGFADLLEALKGAPEAVLTVI